MTLESVGITRSCRDGIDLVTVDHGGVQEVFATLLPQPGDDLGTLCDGCRRVLDQTDSQLLELRVFGPVSGYAPFHEEARRRLGPVEWPLTYVDGAACAGDALAGIHLHAVAGVEVETHDLDGAPLGRLYESEHARHLVLGNVLPPDATRTGSDQTRDTILKIEEGLASAGMDLHSLVRTWFFIDDILGWYGDFNGARTVLYSARGVFDRYVPASTGIGGRNPAGTALVASVAALEAKGEGVVVEEVASPLQCPAGEYGSSFSRAAQVTTPAGRTLFVSGTASIDAEGVTVHVDDVEAQIDQTLRVVGAILGSRGMGFRDVSRANAYFRRAEDASALVGPAAKVGLPQSRVLISKNDICRDDLLFELEVDAVAP